MAQIRTITRNSTTQIDDVIQPQTSIKRTAAYCRVSTLQENQEDSYETQKAYYERFIAASPEMILVGIYGDQGVSGLSARKRPEFKRFMTDCVAGKIDLVLTKSISRFARNLKDCVDCVRLLKGRDCYPSRRRASPATTVERAAVQSLAAVAQEESGGLAATSMVAEQRICRRAVQNDPLRLPQNAAN